MARVDIDAFVAAHAPRWRRLEQLSRRRTLNGPEADELVDGYQEVATHLSVVRSSAPDAGLVAYLSSVLARARTRTTGTRTSSWRDGLTFLTATFPAALYPMRSQVFVAKPKGFSGRKWMDFKPSFTYSSTTALGSAAMVALVIVISAFT